MPRVTDERSEIRIPGKDRFGFKYTINVNAEGEFTTTLPKEAVDKFKELGVDLSRQRNQKGNPGFFTGSTMDELRKQIVDCIKKAESRELIEEKTVIRYAIKTVCSYSKDDDGNILPNPTDLFAEDGKKKSDGGYKNRGFIHGVGDRATSSFDQDPWGMTIYVEPFVKYTYRYNDGTDKSEYHSRVMVEKRPNLQRTKGGDPEFNYYIDYLDFLCGMTKKGIRDEKILEVEATCEVCKFFVDFIKGFCLLNEKLRQFAGEESNLIEPETVERIAANGSKLIGGKNS